MGLLTKFINFILYSNLWIAISAITMTAKTLYLMEALFLEWKPIYGFVFCATLFIYAGHRVIGLKKSEAFIEEGRYKVIADHKSHIVLYAALGFIGTVVFSFMLSWKTWLVMAVPGLVSLAYIFPILSGKEKKRLRDIDDVKIYFVAAVWMMVSVVLPFVEEGGGDYLFLVFSIAEVFLFVFAITIPFDIRDLNVDGHNDVKTIPARLGEIPSKKLAMALLLLSYLSLISNFYCHEYLIINKISLLISSSIGYILTFILIYYSSSDRKDYYYTGLLDGTMISIPLLIILL